MRAPKRSATHTLMGTNTARLKRYDVIPIFSVRGFSLSEWAIAGKAVLITVESRFSMKRAQATMRGMKSWRPAKGMRGNSGQGLLTQRVRRAKLREHR